MNRTNCVISAPITVGFADLTDSHGEDDLAWTIVDPLVVTATFRVGDDEPSEWVISRDLLARGVGSPVAVGLLDVQVRAAGPGRSAIHLAAPEGAAEVLIADHALVEFLDRCEDACPLDSPAEGVRLDALVSVLLRAWALA